MVDIKKLHAVCQSAYDQIETLCRDHEREEHGDKVCTSTRIAAIALIANALGFPSDDTGYQLEFQIALRKCEGQQRAKK